MQKPPRGPLANANTNFKNQRAAANADTLFQELRAMPNLVTGRQLRAARILAGLTQRALAQAVGVHERTARYWELRDQKKPTSNIWILEKIEAVLRRRGVEVFGFPSPGVRLRVRTGDGGVPS
jgi:DNA-binding XRE family transcriptional regulator